MSGQAPLAQRHPGGCYLGFNAVIDRKAAEQLIFVISDAIKNGYGEINLCMPSIGSILDHVYYAFNLIAAMPARLVTWNVGNIQSGANILFLCGNDRYATEGAAFFFHQTGYDPPPGRMTEPYLAGRLKAVQYDDTRSASIIAAKTGRALQVVRAWQNTELVMNTADALAHGLVHSVRALAIPSDAFFHQIIV
jgi:ATP-dependent Clp protease protease subunit